LYAAFGAGRGSVDGYNLPVRSSAAVGDGTVTSFSFSPIAGDETMFTARIGARVHRHLAVEAGYFNFGEYTFRTSALSGGTASLVDMPARARSVGVSLVGIYPVNALDLYARGGYARTQVKADESPAGTSVTANEKFNEAFYGAGIRWNAAPQLGVFAEYQRHDRLGLDGYFAGLEWRF
jgi:hypothetical protein